MTFSPSVLSFAIFLSARSTVKTFRRTPAGFARRRAPFFTSSVAASSSTTMMRSAPTFETHEKTT